MKFEHNGIRFEVSNADHIVINTVRRIIKPAEVTDKGVKPAHVTNEKVRVDEKGTRVWFRLNFAKGTRWAKFRYHGDIPEVPEILADAERWETPEGIQMMIMDVMQRPDVRVWFSGTYVNIEICENWQEVQKIKAQEEARRHKNPRIARRNISVRDIIRQAANSAGAQVRQDAIDTPFGPIPVMTIQGSELKISKRK